MLLLYFNTISCCKISIKLNACENCFSFYLSCHKHDVFVLTMLVGFTIQSVNSCEKRDFKQACSVIAMKKKPSSQGEAVKNILVGRSEFYF